MAIAEVYHNACMEPSSRLVDNGMLRDEFLARRVFKSRCACTLARTLLQGYEMLMILRSSSTHSAIFYPYEPCFRFA